MAKETKKNKMWQSYYGRGEIVINPTIYCRDIGTEPTAVCARDSSEVRANRNLVHDITHELGHILGLADYYCNRHNADGTRHDDYLAPGTVAVLNSWNLAVGCDPKGGNPTQLDKADYRTAYLPATVTNVKGTAGVQAVTLTWDQANVFVESDFEIQWYDGTNWVEEKVVDPNEVSAVLKQQPVGEQRYQIVARTEALPESEVGHGHAHGPASAEVSVTVRLASPANPRVTASSASSLTLAWDAVDGADGYGVRHTTADDCEGEADETISILSHSFTGLNASTTYLLCVRAILAGMTNVTSAWASISGTTDPVSLPPPPPPPDRFEDREVVLSSWTAWELEGDGIVICYFQQYLYERYVIETWFTTYTWNGSRWVPHTSLFHTSDELERKTPLPGVIPVPCIAQSEGDIPPGTPSDGQQYLLGGDYVFSWGEASVGFTVPDDARFRLTWRVTESGVRAAVLTDNGEGEVVIDPDALTEPSVRAASGDNRSVALQTTEQSIRFVETETKPAADPQQGVCSVASSDDSPPTIALDYAPCTTVASGGAVRIMVGVHELTLTLTPDRHWLIVRLKSGGAGSFDQIGLFDAASRSSLLLNPVTGAEIARTISGDDPKGLEALFDAIIASAQPAAVSD